MKKIKICAIVGITCLLLCSSECSSNLGHYDISIHNNANHHIDVLISFGDPLYPDTLLPDRFYGRLNPIPPGRASYGRGGRVRSYKQFIQSYGSDTIIIFIFHTDTIEKYTWDEIREGYKILKRYDISWQEMEQLNGRIFYPPTEAMRNIRQYPPFGQ